MEDLQITKEQVDAAFNVLEAYKMQLIVELSNTIRKQKEIELVSSKINGYANINDLPTSMRLSNCLNSMGIVTLNDCKNYPPNHFKKVRNFGKKTLEELQELLTVAGVDFKIEI